MLGTKRRAFGNIVGHVKGVEDMSSLGVWTAGQFDPRLSWADIEWIKKRWGGKLVLKGILDAEDAQLAVDSGADAIVVSNHGGRQLDGAPSSIAALPAIADAVGSKIEVWMDGGIRSGQDLLKAWALGARGTLIGRAFVYGLGRDGPGRRDPRPRGAAQRGQPDHGLLRPHRHPPGRSAHPAAGHLLSVRRLGRPATPAACDCGVTA